jgi:membrane associated rhomboid family serine protease
MNNTSLIRKPLKYSFYNAAYVIIGLNILVFLITTLSPRTTIYLALSPIAVINNNMYWQFLTYMFTHGGITHILFNMLALLFFGTQVEKRMGSHEFVLFYLFTGLAAGIFSYIIYYATGSYGSFLLGASGAVYAVLLAYATYYPDSMIYVMGIIPVRAPILVLIYTAIAIFSQISSYNAGVAHLTHLAGFAFAFLYFVIRFAINPAKVFFGGDRHRLH